MFGDSPEALMVTAHFSNIRCVMWLRPRRNLLWLYSFTQMERILICCVSLNSCRFRMVLTATLLRLNAFLCGCMERTFDLSLS